MMYLDDETLGVLNLECGTGYVVADFQIGWPTVREVVNPRALTDGVVDTTTYLGARAVSVTLRLDQRVMPTQDLLDLVTPFMSPRYRPRIVWTVQDTTAYCPGYIVQPYHIRSLRLRGADAPLLVDGPRYLTIGLQWIAQDPFTSALEETCVVAGLTGTEEFGRVYDLSFDRDYPFSPPYGITYFTPIGTATMDWIGTLSAPTSALVNPSILVNNSTITFTGLTLLAGQTVIINTQERTILRNGDINDSVYGLTNFADWTWDDLRVTPGQNQIRLQGTSMGTDASFTLCYFDRWYV